MEFKIINLYLDSVVKLSDLRAEKEYKYVEVVTFWSRLTPQGNMSHYQNTFRPQCQAPGYTIRSFPLNSGRFDGSTTTFTNELSYGYIGGPLLLRAVIVSLVISH